MRMPILASAQDAGKNAYNMFMLGFNPGGMSGAPVYGAGWAGGFKPGLSVGGLATVGGLASTGAAIGYGLSTQLEGSPTTEGAMIGAAAGAAAFPVLGAAARAATWAAPKIGRGVYNAMAAVPNATLNAAGGLSSLAINSPMMKYGKLPMAGLGLAASLVRFDKHASAYGHSVDDVTGKTLPGVALTGPISGAIQGWKSEAGKLGVVGRAGRAGLGAIVNGQTVLWGATLFAGAKEAVGAFEEAHLGQITPGIRRPAPRVPFYDQNAGATGDLVFAMNKNRRG